MLCVLYIETRHEIQGKFGKINKAPNVQSITISLYLNLISLSSYTHTSSETEHQISNTVSCYHPQVLYPTFSKPNDPLDELPSNKNNHLI
jgi:hypothetical protein